MFSGMKVERRIEEDRIPSVLIGEQTISVGICCNVAYLDAYVLDVFLALPAHYGRRCTESVIIDLQIVFARNDCFLLNVFVHVLHHYLLLLRR